MTDACNRIITVGHGFRYPCAHIRGHCPIHDRVPVPINPSQPEFHTHDHDTGLRISGWGIDHDRSHPPAPSLLDQDALWGDWDCEPAS